MFSDVLIGAGLNGLLYDTTAAIKGQDSSWTGWGMALGVGAITAAVGFGIGAGFDAIPGAIGTKFGAEAGATATRLFANPAGKALTGFVSGAATGALTGVGGQLVTNYINHDAIGKDLGQAAGIGAVTGALLGCEYLSAPILCSFH